MEDSIATIVSSFTLTSRGRRPLLAAQRPALFWKPCSLCQHFQWGKSRIMERAAHIQIIPNRELARAKIHHRSMSMAAGVPWMLGMADTMWASIAPLGGLWHDWPRLGSRDGYFRLVLLDYTHSHSQSGSHGTGKNPGYREDLKLKSESIPWARGSANRTQGFAMTPPRLTFRC